MTAAERKARAKKASRAAAGSGRLHGWLVGRFKKMV
jgi:hypothetical protein